jgi:hypothetical protein
MKIDAHQVLKGNNSHQELFFFYDPLEKKVVFSNQPAPIFFNADVKIAGHFKFPHDPADEKMKNALAKWDRSLLLMNGETQHWDMLLETNKGKECFEISATGIEPVEGRLMVHYLVRRSSDDALVDPFRDKYNEFIDMAAHNLDAPVRKLSVLCDTIKIKMAKGEDLRLLQLADYLTYGPDSVLGAHAFVAVQHLHFRMLRKDAGRLHGADADAVAEDHELHPLLHAMRRAAVDHPHLRPAEAVGAHNDPFRNRLRERLPRSRRRDSGDGFVDQRRSVGRIRTESHRSHLRCSGDQFTRRDLRHSHGHSH